MDHQLRSSRSDRVLARADSAEGEAVGRRRSSGPALPGLLAAVSVLVAAIAWVTADETAAEPAALPTLEAPASVGVEPEVPEAFVVSTSTVPATTTTTSAVAIADASFLTTTDALPDLEGTIVLAEFPNGLADTNVWVLGSDERGHFGQSFRLPLYPGGYPYPLIVTDDLIAFADLREAYAFDRDEDRLELISEASFLVPGSTKGEIWVIGEGADWIAQYDTATGDITERFDVSESVQWPLAGLDDGLLVSPFDEEAFGSVAFWTPNTGLQSLDPPLPVDFYLVAASGSIAVFVGPHHEVTVVDLASREMVSEFHVDFGETTILDGCLSPQEHFVALVGITGKVVVVATDDGAVMHELRAWHSYNSVAWTAPQQLVALVENDDGVQLDVVDVFTGRTATIAESQNRRMWMASAVSTC